jgi:hypothetical protein
MFKEQLPFFPLTFEPDVVSSSYGATECGPMAIKLKVKSLSNPWELLKKFGVDGELIQAAKDYGISVELVLPDGLEFKVPQGSSVPAIDSISLGFSIMDYLAGQASKTVVLSLVPVISKLLVNLVSNQFLEQAVFIPTGVEKAVLSSIKNVLSDGEPVVQAIKKEDGSGISVGLTAAVAAVEKAYVSTENSEPVKLAQAQHLYQKVLGTSPKSYYYVVAMATAPLVAVAAKLQGARLSVRVEGNFDAQDWNKVAVCKGGSAGTYLSGHFDATEKAPVDKILGAVLVGSGVEFDTPMPSMKKLRQLCQG